MGLCACGFSTEYPSCNGTHKVVKAVKDKIIEEIEKIPLESNGAQLNALGMRILTIDLIKKIKGV
jgi:CDGSH-type Zn-finger protein